MVEKVDLNKKVYEKNSYTKTIDTKFKELGVTSVAKDLSDTISVDDFFSNYNSIFYQIPKNGDSNSHEFLVKTSGDYIDFNQINEQILALQKEISTLRETNLQQSITILGLQTGQTFNITGSIPSIQ